MHPNHVRGICDGGQGLHRNNQDQTHALLRVTTLAMAADIGLRMCGASRGLVAFRSSTSRNIRPGPWYVPHCPSPTSSIELPRRQCGRRFSPLLVCLLHAWPFAICSPAPLPSGDTSRGTTMVLAASMLCWWRCFCTEGDDLREHKGGHFISVKGVCCIDGLRHKAAHTR